MQDVRRCRYIQKSLVIKTLSFNMEVRDGKQMAREEWRKTERETDLGLECGWDPRRGKQRCMSFGSKISSREDSLTLARGQLRVFCPDIQVTHFPR